LKFIQLEPAAIALLMGVLGRLFGRAEGEADDETH
jgi:hypothetical protein